jgi:peptidoglycan/LPS O-acetylase OafA/YrhL
MKPQSSSDHGYRPDVDGLRAIAVLSVMVFHVSTALLPGGFVGVDIFFVISGFLITRNILQDLELGRFSIAEFYRRRIKRIAPPMLVVVFLTILTGQILMVPEDASKMAKSAVWSLSSLANVYFWKYQDTGYFAPDSRHSPLLHLWSLGVEEQFYILFPVLLMLLYRKSRARSFLVAGVGIALLSFFLGDALFTTDPSFVYYMLPTRAGELLVGALVALIVLKKAEQRIPEEIAKILPALGAVLLGVSFFLLAENQIFPGWRAMLPTIGTAMLLLAGQCRDNYVSRSLKWRPLVVIGLMSYSAYLWHWPLLAFFRYGYGEPGPISGLILFALTLGVAWISYLYVEQPARKSRVPILPTLVRQYLVPAGALGCMALVIIYGDRIGVRLHFNTYLAQLKEIRNQTQPAYFFDYVCQRQRVNEQDTIDEHCIVGANSADAPRAILWGDSNAAHYVGLLGQFAQEAGYRFRNVEIGSCPPIDQDPKPFIEARREADCRESLKIVRRAIEDFPVVMMSASWSTYQANSESFLPAVFDTVTSLTRKGKLVILIGKAPVINGYDRLCREKALSYPLLDCPNPMVPFPGDVASINDKLKKFAEQTSNVHYFEVTPFLCPKGVCAAFDADGEPRYSDPSHLTIAASWKLGKEIVQLAGVPMPFTLVPNWSKHVAVLN